MLTDAQAAAVKKRVDTLNATFKKQKRQKRTDVRDIFSSDTQVSSGALFDRAVFSDLMRVHSDKNQVESIHCNYIV